MIEIEECYTPDIEELHVGYICKRYRHMVGGNPSWEDHVIQVRERDDRDVVDMEVDTNLYATRYLNREDIESLGWKKDEWLYYMDVDDRCYSMYSSFFEGKHEDRLWCIQNEDTKDILFNGAIKSINELKMIMKFIEITNG